MPCAGKSSVVPLLVLQLAFSCDLGQIYRPRLHEGDLRHLPGSDRRQSPFSRIGHTVFITRVSDGFIEVFQKY